MMTLLHSEVRSQNDYTYIIYIIYHNRARVTMTNIKKRSHKCHSGYRLNTEIFLPQEQHHVTL